MKIEFKLLRCMITMGMNAQEILEHFDKDKNWLYGYATSFSKEADRIFKKYPATKGIAVTKRSKVTHQKYFVVIANKKIKRRSKNTSYILCNILAEVREGKDVFYFSCTFNSYDGYTEAFTPHFFERYAERTGRGVMPIGKSIAYYLSTNGSICEIYANDDRSVYAGEEGIALSHRNDQKKIIYNRTFVSYDMLKSTQKESFELAYPTLVMYEKSLISDLVNGCDLRSKSKEFIDSHKCITDECNEIYGRYFE